MNDDIEKKLQAAREQYRQLDDVIKRLDSVIQSMEKFRRQALVTNRDANKLIVALQDHLEKSAENMEKLGLNNKSGSGRKFMPQAERAVAPKIGAEDARRSA